MKLRSPLLSCAPPLPLPPLLQEYGAALKVVKVEADANKATLEKYKVRFTAVGWTGLDWVDIDTHRVGLEWAVTHNELD